MKRLFFGGIHPNANKEMSLRTANLQHVAPKFAVIPMQQHIGVACLPLVKVGDHVLRGQKIGDAEGLCVPVHASISGKVAAVEPRPHTSGRAVMAVVIENDFQDQTIDSHPLDRSPNELSGDEILARIRDAGVVGMGGAAFPGNVKALSAMGKIDTLIANGCECEPYITADDTLLRTDARAVLEGLNILRHVLCPKRVCLATEENKAQAIEAIQQAMEDRAQIELCVLPTRYPQGSEKQLIQALTGREVMPGQLPISVGCAVFNVATLAAIARAVYLGEAMTQRIVTVSGENIREPQNMIVRIGTSFGDLIEKAGGLRDETQRVIAGGPMMGIAQKEMSVPVIKATNCVLCLPKDPNGATENPVCLRCGKCVSVCPMRLQPLYLYRYQKTNNKKELHRLHLMDCIECGCCTFVCPGKLPLVECFRKGKAMLKEANLQ